LIVNFGDDELLSLGPVVRHVVVRRAKVRSAPLLGDNIVGKLDADAELIGLVVEGAEVEGDLRWLLIGNNRYVHLSVLG
jgi:hypothetical protein